MTQDLKDKMIRIFIGYDHREPIAYHVCAQSIMEYASQPVAVIPLRLSNLKGVLRRPREDTQLTDFSYSRFLVPYLCNYQGWALFIDGDMLLREDITKLWLLRDNRHAVMVVKHPDFQKVHSFLGVNVQWFPMFNWSSVMLFNNAKCKKLTTQYINSAPYQDLHQFKWLESEKYIGDLPETWNHLVGYYPLNPEVALVHWTLGGPYLGGDFEKADYAAEWFSMRDKTFFSTKIET
jgi:lipopolysaccharide biosynthesis glycosyltransferase